MFRSLQPQIYMGMDVIMSSQSSVHFPGQLSLVAFASRLPFHAYTVFLFTKSDIITTLVPVGLFAMGAAPLSPTHLVSHTLQCAFWLWLHILQFCLSNQTRDPDEDKTNKPWRALPSGRITLPNAIILKYVVTAISLLVSYYYSISVFMASATLVVATYLHNDMHGSKHWISKSLLNSIGYGCFAAGATLVVAADRRWMDFTGAFSVSVLAAILLTTIHTQDFRDVIGDKAVGRSTLPIAFPNMSRFAPLVTLGAWSLYLTVMWEMSTLVGIGITVFAIIIGIRYYLWRSADDDERSYVLYNIWLSFALLMPGYWRMYRDNAAQ